MLPGRGGFGLHLGLDPLHLFEGPKESRARPNKQRLFLGGRAQLPYYHVPDGDLNDEVWMSLELLQERERPDLATLTGTFFRTFSSLKSLLPKYKSWGDENRGSQSSGHQVRPDPLAKQGV